MWAPQMKTLSEHCRILAPDVRGFGASPDFDHQWTLGDAADDFIVLLDTLGIPTVTLAGLSMGGYLAFELLRKRPGMIERLILADTRARADNPAEGEARTRLAESVEHRGTETLVEAMMPRLLRDNADPGVRELIRPTIAGARPSSVAQALRAMRDRPDSTSLLAEIGCPVLVLVGREDLVTTVEESRKMADAIPGARYEEIPDAGHLSNLENPEAFNRAVHRFLEET